MTQEPKSFFQFFCATCKKPIEWKGNPFRPFCSDRCKQIDLGKWATESYRVPGEVAEGDEILEEGTSTDDE